MQGAVLEIIPETHCDPLGAAGYDDLATEPRFGQALGSVGFGCGASVVPMTLKASLATGSAADPLVLWSELPAPSGASGPIGPLGPGFDAAGEGGAGATVGGRVRACGVAAFFLARAGGRFALSLAFDFGRACFRVTDFLFVLIAVFFGRAFAADLARRNFALVLPFAVAAFLPFVLRAMVSSP
jgi:hypothetical protein